MRMLLHSSIVRYVHRNRLVEISIDKPSLVYADDIKILFIEYQL
jgi:hypothetical protein